MRKDLINLYRATELAQATVEARQEELRAAQSHLEAAQAACNKAELDCESSRKQFLAAFGESLSPILTIEETVAERLSRRFKP